MKRSAMLALVLTACGVPQSQFDAKALEVENFRRQLQDQSGKGKDIEVKLAELEKRATDAEGKLTEATTARTQLEEQMAQVDAQRLATEQKLAEANAVNAQLSEGSKKLQEAKDALEKKSGEYEMLAKSLRDEIKTGKIELSELRGRMVVKMKDKILFSSGSTKVAKEGQAALAKVAEALKGVEGKLIRVEGHTDNVPVDPKGTFPSNWELSTSRSIEVLKLLVDGGVPAGILSAAGYGEFQPVANNASPSGKSLNRRIEIVLVAGEQAPSGKVVPVKPAAKVK